MRRPIAEVYSGKAMASGHVIMILTQTGLDLGMQTNKRQFSGSLKYEVRHKQYLLDTLAHPETYS